MNPSTIISKRLYVTLALACAQALGQSTARIQGTVTEDNGQLVPGAVVALHKAPRVARSAQPGAGRTAQQRVPGDPDVDLTTAAGTSGAFAFSGLPTGLYTLCAAVAQGAYLPTCEWGRPLTVSLAPGETQAGKQIRVARGASLNVRLNDATGALSPTDTIASTRMVIGVGTATGEFHTAPIVAKDSTGRNHSVTVPFDTPLFVWVASRDLAVTYGTGNAIPQLGLASHFNVPSGTPGPTFTFTITGAIK